MGDNKDNNKEVENNNQNNQDNNVDNKDVNDTGKENDHDAGASGESGKKNERTFTQDQVSKMMTKEKNQGRNAALKELGIDPNNADMLKLVQTFVSSQKTEEEKATEQKLADAAKIAEAEAKAQRAECKAEAMVLGAKPEFVDDVITLAMAKMNEDSDFKTVIGEIKTKYPTFFGIETKDDDKDNKDATGKKGTGASMKNLGKDNKGNDDKSMGSRLAAQHKVVQRKDSNFMKR